MPAHKLFGNPVFLLVDRPVGIVEFDPDEFLPVGSEYAEIRNALPFDREVLILGVLGIIGEYTGRIYMCINNQPQYVIESIVKDGEDLL